MDAAHAQSRNLYLDLRFNCVKRYSAYVILVQTMGVCLSWLSNIYVRDSSLSYVKDLVIYHKGRTLAIKMWHLKQMNKTYGSVSWDVAKEKYLLEHKKQNIILY